MMSLGHLPKFKDRKSEYNLLCLTKKKGFVFQDILAFVTRKILVSRLEEKNLPPALGLNSSLEACEEHLN